jgi:Flp pilus assembly protein TadD
MESSIESHSESRSEDEAGTERAARDVDSLLARTGSRPPSEEVRASLAAIQAARTAAEQRMQRDSFRIRALTMIALALIAVGSFALAGHLRARHHAAAAKAAAAAIAPALPAPAPESPAPAPVAVAEAAPANDEVSTVTPAARSVSPDALPACLDAYERHRWHAAAAACADAFTADAHDASLALKVAQAQHARAHYADAGDWARRALALEDADPEAFVILAHAERRAGHPMAARNAYHQYLLLAPHGWHAGEARAALRGARASARNRAAGRASREREGSAPLAEETPRAE